MFKRIALFLMVNMAIFIVAGITLSLIGYGGGYFETDAYSSEVRQNYEALFAFCAVFGFAGAFISLLLSKFMAKMMTRAKIITGSEGSRERWLVTTVERLAQQAGIGNPEVAIFPTEGPNAFATGWNRNKALVAVSSGMLQQFPDNEIEAVMAHEIGHVANGDMITLTLIQGVINTFVMFFARVIGFAIDKMLFRDQENRVGFSYYIVVFVIEILLSILANIIVMWFSRKREFRADKAGAKLAGRENMISALERLNTMQSGAMPDSMLAFGIKSKPGRIKSSLFSSHPPLEERIARLRSA